MIIDEFASSMQNLKKKMRNYILRHSFILITLQNEMFYFSIEVVKTEKKN